MINERGEFIREQPFTLQAVAPSETIHDINLDALQQEVEKLLRLLTDRQPGLISWNHFMNERLENLHKLTSQALGK